MKPEYLAIKENILASYLWLVYLLLNKSQGEILPSVPIPSFLRRVEYNG